MSYKVLYRKYRPDSFDKIVGQNSIVNNLKNSIINNSFSHAYIFTGPRGTGKTSTAKVLAKAINCTNSTNGEACNTCESCINFATSPDIIEIDAASNNGVDEIRELRNNITLAPSASKFKIYIIDEVHMLSAGAFNALLKTLEEPPAHAIFILATTEVYKVPITILSRCQRYDFKKINKSDLIEHLKYICSSENITYEEDALEEIYSLSEGCLRDALSILDQISKTSSHITQNDILTEYNIISNNTVKKLLEYVHLGDVEGLLKQLESFENSGMNAQKLIKKIINYLEKIAIDIKINKEKKYSFDMIDHLISSLNKCYVEARINENIFTMIKLSFLELIQTPISKGNTNDGSNIENAKKNEIAVENLEMPVQSDLSLIDIRINNCFVEVNKTSLATISNIWKELEEGAINSLKAGDYSIVAASSKYAIFTADESSLSNLFNIKHADVEKALNKSGLDIKVVAITTDDWQKEKEKYKNRIKSKKAYVYIDEPEETEDTSELKEQLEGLFTEKIVEIS